VKIVAYRDFGRAGWPSPPSERCCQKYLDAPTDLCFTGAWRHRVKRRAVLVVIALIGALGLSVAPATRAQYTADFQDAIISGVTSNWSGSYIVGSNTFADILFVQNGGVLADGNGYLGYEASGSNNVAAVIGSGSVWSNASSLYVGNSGANNFLWIADGGAVVVSNSYVGYNVTGSNNEVLVDGPSSVWSNSGDLAVGYNGSSNTLTISGGAKVYNNNGYIGFGYTHDPNESDNNGVIVSGNGSVWSDSGGLSIGFVEFNGGGANFGNALTISNGGAVYCGGSQVGDSSVVVTGNGSVWSNAGSLSFSGFPSASNELTIADGGAVYSGSGYVITSVSIAGTGSVWSNSGELFVNAAPEEGPFFGSMVISNGGAVYSGSGEVVGYDEDLQTVVVTGPGSVWRIEDGLVLAGYYYVYMIIANGGAVYSGSGDFQGAEAGGGVQVTGAGSVWHVENDLVIDGKGSVIIAGGGAMYSGSGDLGDLVGVLVTGTGSVWRIENDLGMNNSQDANWTIADDGAVFAANVFSGNYYNNPSINVSGGTLCVTNGLGTGVLEIDGGTLSINAGTVTAGQFVLSDGDGDNTFSFTSGLLVTGGTFVTNGQNFVIGDGTDVATFHLAGGFHSFANGLLVDTNSSVTGCGTLDGSVVIDPDATVLANCGGTLTFTGIVTNNGTLRAINGSILEFYGPVVNNGLIDITGGTTNFHNTFVNNGSILSAATPFRITSIAKQANNILITWQTTPGQTNELQATSGGPGGSYSTNNFTPIFTVTNTVGSVTNYLDIGAATNNTRYYRVRLVP